MLLILKFWLYWCWYLCWRPTWTCMSRQLCGVGLSLQRGSSPAVGRKPWHMIHSSISFSFQVSLWLFGENWIDSRRLPWYMIYVSDVNVMRNMFIVWTLWEKPKKTKAVTNCIVLLYVSEENYSMVKVFRDGCTKKERLSLLFLWNPSLIISRY